MLTIKLTIDSAAAIRQGLAREGGVSLILADEDVAGLPPEERAVLARLLDNVALGEGRHHGIDGLAGAPTSAGIGARRWATGSKDELIGHLTAAGDEIRATRAERAERADAERVKEAAGHEAAVAYVLATDMADLVKYDPWRGGWTPHGFPCRADDRIAARLAEATAEAERRDESSREARAQAKREAAEAPARKRAAVVAWCVAHGSARLRRIAEEGLIDSAMALYEAEHEAAAAAELATALPGWSFADESADEEEEDDDPPTDEDFAGLDAARRLVPAAKLERRGGRFVPVAEFGGRTIVFGGDDMAADMEREAEDRTLWADQR